MLRRLNRPGGNNPYFMPESADLQVETILDHLTAGTAHNCNGNEMCSYKLPNQSRHHQGTLNVLVSREAC